MFYNSASCSGSSISSSSAAVKLSLEFHNGVPDLPTRLKTTNLINDLRFLTCDKSFLPSHEHFYASRFDANVRPFSANKLQEKYKRAVGRF